MDVQFWIYIIIGVIYFLAKMLKKPEQAPGESTDTRPPGKRTPFQPEQTTSESPRQLTFEELLREITEGKQVQAPQRQSEPEPRFETFENEFKEEARSLEEVGYNEVENAKVYKAYQDNKSQEFDRKSLEETLKLQDTIIDFGKFKAFETEKRKNLLNEYVNIIRNPETLKQAVVMSEILNRKF